MGESVWRTTLHATSYFQRFADGVKDLKVFVKKKKIFVSLTYLTGEPLGALSSDID